MSRNRLEQLYEDEFDGFIEFEDEDQKLEMLREEQALLEYDDDEEEGIRQRRPTLSKHNNKKSNKKRPSSGVTSTTASNSQQPQNGSRKKSTTQKKKQGDEGEESSGPKLPLKYRRIAKYTDKQMGFHVLHQSLSENDEFNELSRTTLTSSNEKSILSRRLNIYLDTLHDWCRTIFPDLSFDEALAFMESQSFSNRVHQAMEWGRSTFSSRYQKAVQVKEQRKRKRTQPGTSSKASTGRAASSTTTSSSILDEMDDEASHDHDEETNPPLEEDGDRHQQLNLNTEDGNEIPEDDDEMHETKESSSPYKPHTYSKEDGEEEFRFEDYNNDDEEEEEANNEEAETNPEEPSPKKKKPSPNDDNSEEEKEQDSEVVITTKKKRIRRHSKKSAVEIFLGDLLPSNRQETPEESASSSANHSLSQSLIPSSPSLLINEQEPLEESLEI
ncbi:hypothetical protein C9374_006657 [Naegleria lovaniensis]|uniref:Uncharacterized protein n=1 Tax=Naegleria lovaniensis TaxID=51637 RepID=A0AA88KHG3_NAELO|nr:uncharacterized protein C9374_006657 [Naegleria lovaniensis]KAG2379540.1 hypothetical protein C9374_006657 [Naegleria lovaniensis]